MTAKESGNHSWFAHVLVENIDDIFAEFEANGEMMNSVPQDKP
jgi:hypothetical protein